MPMLNLPITETEAIDDKLFELEELLNEYLENRIKADVDRKKYEEQTEEITRLRLQIELLKLRRGYRKNKFLKEECL